MATVTIGKPDRDGVRIKVKFEDKNDAEAVWLCRNRPEWVVQTVKFQSEARYKITDDAEWFLLEAAVLAAREFLKPDPLDETAPTH